MWCVIILFDTKLRLFYRIKNKKIKGKISPINVSFQPLFLKLYFPLEMNVPVIAMVNIAIPKISKNQIHLTIQIIILKIYLTII